MKTQELSSGRLTSLARLLVFLGDNPGLDVLTACENLVGRRHIQSEQLATEAIETATSLGLLNLGSDPRNLSNAGKSIVIGNKDESGMSLQRRLLLKIILTVRRDLLWTAFADHKDLQLSTPSLHQILVELKLIERKPSSESEAFWNDMRKAEIRFNDAVLKKIGDQAESWSMMFESQRLKKMGRSDLADEIKWLSRESDLHGYDILSFGGEAKSPTDRRHIEVKRAKFVELGFLEFHLTENEHRQSQILGDKYFFHLWWVAPSESIANLSICSSTSVNYLVPRNVDSFNYWTECVVRYEVSQADSTHAAVDLST
jgi:hypothetical protein